uniref:Uncharacterized protein n=1 Tax=viral metagenome TaxID=1070528 RepID=A0A6M3JY21_9ZZZZ
MSENGNEIKIEAPDKCIGCGWIPEQAEAGKELALGSSWLVVPIRDSVVWLHICPKCGRAMGNKNAVENVRKLQEIKKQRVVQPRPGKIVLAGSKGAPIGRN